MRTLKHRLHSKICYFLMSASFSFLLPFAVMSQPNVTLDGTATFTLESRILIAQETGGNEIVIRDGNGDLVNTISLDTAGNNIKLIAENFDLEAGDEILVNVDKTVFFYQPNGTPGKIYPLASDGYLAAGDIDGDSLPEIFVTSFKIDKYSQVEIYDGETGNAFPPVSIRALNKNAPLSIAVTDVDNDKVVDLAILGDLKGNEVAVYYLNGTEPDTFEVFADDKKTGKSNTPAGRRLVRKKPVENDNGNGNGNNKPSESTDTQASVTTGPTTDTQTSATTDTSTTSEKPPKKDNPPKSDNTNPQTSSKTDTSSTSEKTSGQDKQPPKSDKVTPPSNGADNSDKQTDKSSGRNDNSQGTACQNNENASKCDTKEKVPTGNGNTETSNTETPDTTESSSEGDGSSSSESSSDGSSTAESSSDGSSEETSTETGETPIEETTLPLCDELLNVEQPISEVTDSESETTVTESTIEGQTLNCIPVKAESIKNSPPGQSGSPPGQSNNSTQGSPPGQSGQVPNQSDDSTPDLPPGQSGQVPGQSDDSTPNLLPGQSGQVPNQSDDSTPDLPPGQSDQVPGQSDDSTPNFPPGQSGQVPGQSDDSTQDGESTDGTETGDETDTSTEIETVLKPEHPHPGVKVATGNVDEDGRPEIIVGAAEHGGKVEVYTLEGDFIAEFETGFTHGVELAVGCVDGDHIDEIIVGDSEGTQVLILKLKGQKLHKINSFQGLDDGQIGSIAYALEAVEIPITLPPVEEEEEIEVLEETEETQQEPALPATVKVELPPGTPVCNIPTGGIVTETCDGKGQTIVDAIIGEGVHISNVTLDGDVVTNHGTLSNVTITPDTTLIGGQVTGFVDNQGTLANVEFVGSQITGGNLVGNIDIPIDGSGLGLYQDVSILPDTTIIGGTPKGEIANEGTLVDAIIPKGTVIDGGTLVGHIENEGTLQNVILAENTDITGGQLAGMISGPAPKEIGFLEEIRFLNVLAGTQLSNVIIGDGVSFSDPADTIIGPGVLFTDNQNIPVAGNLTPAYTKTFGKTVAVDTNVKLLTDPEAPTLLTQLNTVLAETGDSQIVQNPDNGQLEVEQGDLFYSILPVEVTQTAQAPGLVLHEDMTVTLITEPGREVSALPVIQGLDELLEELGQTYEDVVFDAGTLKIGEQYYRADFFSQTVSDDAVLGLFDQGQDKRHVFEKNGKKRQQMLNEIDPDVANPPVMSECQAVIHNPPSRSSIYAPRIKGDKFAPGQKKRLKHDEAEFNMDSENALASDTEICIKSLYPLELPEIPKNLINVTKGPRGAFEFFPKGQHFNDDVKVKIPYHKGKLAGKSEEYIQIYYYDETSRLWKKLERDNLDTNGRAITAKTNHFTVMMAAVKGDEMFEPEDYKPEDDVHDFKDKANPGQNIKLCSVPKANAMGSVVVDCPLDVTKGRVNLQPKLAVKYNSMAGNGWMGLGWNMPVSAIEVETRWGVPRYHSTKETETYALNGEMLTPIVHRGPLENRSGSEKIFHTRIEGEFNKIIRHGTNPKNYWWEVRDKNGTASYYGGDPSSSGAVANATLTDAKGNIFHWALRKVQDTNGNTITYQHQRVAHNSTPRGYDLYLTQIRYTGRNNQPGSYQITFTRDSNRPDVISNARGGFMRVTADRLQRIDITYNNQPVRSYEFVYETGAFHKSLLASITQRGADGSQFHQHTFKYYDEARTNGQYNGFAAKQTWNTGEDNLTIGFDGEGNATAFGGTTTESEGGALYLGLNDTYRDKTQSLGARYGYSITKSEGLITFEDINGDTLPDKIFKTDDGVFYRPNQSGPNGTTEFGEAQLVPGLPRISVESSRLFSVGPEIYEDEAHTLNNNNSFTKTEAYFSDVNADGLMDFVDNGQVLYNVLDTNGHPTFTPGDSTTTPAPILDDDSETTDTSNLLKNYGTEYQRQIDIFPLIDVVRRWEVQYDGQIQITGAVQLQQPEAEALAKYEGTPDGVRVAIQHNSTELWSTEIGATDYTPKTPSDVDAISVTAGDMIYFRVQSREDGAFDQVEWIPDIRYNNQDPTLDVNNLDLYHYNAEDDFFLTGYAGMFVSMPIAGQVRVTGELQKLAPLTDDITLRLYKQTKVNGELVDSIEFEQTLAAADTGSIQLNKSITVNAQDHITAHVFIDSTVDLTQLVWNEDNPLTLSYESSADPKISTADLADENGQPLIQTPMFCSFDVYPVVNTTAEPEPWKVPKSDNFVIAPLLAGLNIDPDIDTTIVMTFKKQGELLEKHEIQVSGGQITNGSLTLPGRLKDEEIYVELSTTEPDLMDQLSQIDAAATDTDGIIGSMPMVFRSPNPYQVVAQPYRGWTTFGYEGNRERANNPITITQDDLEANDFKAAIDELETAYQDGTLDDTLAQADAANPANAENGCDVVADGQVLCLQFDGNANDGSGNGNHGTVNGATLTTDRFGNPKSAYQFDGVDDVIQVADSPSLNFGTDDLSIALWVNTSVESPIPPASSCCIAFIDKREEGSGGYHFYYREANIGLQLLNDGQSTNNYAKNSNVVTGNWQFISVTVDRDQVNGGKLYVDGVLAYTFDPTDKSETLDNLSDLSIGKNVYGNELKGVKLFEGMLDDIRIYNRSLSQDEITTLYTLDSGYKEQPATGCDKVPLGQVACYSFDGNANDESGNGNHGTENGGITYVAGKTGQAAQFDGETAYLELANTLNATHGLTFAFWMYPQPQIPGQFAGTIISKYDWQIERDFIVHILNENDHLTGENQSVSAFFGNGLQELGDQADYTYAQIETEQWQHVVVNVTENAFQLYLNGEKVHERAREYPEYDNNDSINTYIGNTFYWSEGDNNHFHGSLDDFHIYNRPLSESEIQELYGDSTGGLIAHYSFDGNAEDSSGNENHGVENGGVTYATGISGQAAQFDGIDDYIAINPQSDVSQVGDFTLSSWVFVPAGSTKVGRGYVFDGHSHSNTVTSDFYAEGPTMYYDYHTQTIGHGVMYDSSSWGGPIISYDLSGSWHHMVSIRQGEQLSSYIDGQLVSGQTGNNKTLDMAHNWFIGTFSGNNPNYSGNFSFEGLIDELRIYDHALSEAEISELYNENSSSADVSVTDDTGTNSSVSTDSLVAHYSFEGNANDSSGNENHGIINGATLTTDRFGNANSAYRFNGVDDYIQINDNALFDVSDVTVMAWVKWEGSTPTNDYSIVSNYSGRVAASDNLQHYGLRINQSSISKFFYDDGSEWDSVVGSSSIDDGEWHFLVGVLKAGVDAKIYVDGQLESTDTGSIPTSLLPSGDLYIGRDGTAEAELRWNGVIDDVRIYSSALPESEITQLYLQPEQTTTGGTGSSTGTTGTNSTSSSSTTSYLEQGMDGVAKTLQLNVIPFYPEIDNKRWKGTDNSTWATATQMSSSRWGMDHLEVPKADSLTGTRAVPRISQNQAKAHSAETGAAAGTASVGVLDFMDFNGDGLPDAAGHNGVQFSEMTGGLESDRQQSDLPGLREAQASANNTVSGNPPQIMADGSGYIRSLGSEMPPIGVTGNTSDGNAGMTTDLKDINADGLPDKLIYQANGQLWVAFNLGYQFGTPEPWGTAQIQTQNSGQSLPGAVGFNTGDYSFVAGESLSRNASTTNSLLDDLNGDGLLDFLEVDNNGQLQVALNTGNGFTTGIPWGQIDQGLAKNSNTAHGQGKFFSIGIGPLQCQADENLPGLEDLAGLTDCYVILNPGNHKGQSMDRPEVQLSDIDGDGYIDYLHSDQDSSINVQTNPIGRTNLLQQVERPLGAKITVDYQRVGNTYRQPHSHWVMSSVEVDDGHHQNDGVDVQLTTFRYVDGYFNRQERAFYGYQSVIEEQRDSTDDSIYRTITREYYNDIYYRRGRLIQETTTDNSGAKYRQNEQHHTLYDVIAAANVPNAIITDLLDGATTQIAALEMTVFPQLTRLDRRFYEGQATAGKATYVEYGYDQYGNTNYALDAADTGSQDDVIIQLGYFADLNQYIVGKPESISIRNSSGLELRHREATFQPGTGNLTQLREYLETGQAAITDYQYDQYGNRIVATGPSNHKGQRYSLYYTYDNPVHTHITQIRDSFGYSSSADYDLRFGTVTQTWDTNNNPMQYSYDTYGRLVTVKGPYEIQAGLPYAMQFDYHPNDVVPWVLTKYMDAYRGNDPIETVHFVDGLNRLVQFKKDVADHGQDVMQVSNRVKFDHVGRVIAKYYPVTESRGNQGVFNASFDSIPPTVFEYDILDRVLSETNPAGERHRKVYGFGTDRDGKQQFQIRDIDANGIPTDTFFDVRNLQTAVRQFNNGGAEVIWTSFKFDPMKKITQVLDNVGNLTLSEYDNLGRRTVIDNKDTGLTETVYDSAGNIIQKITAVLRAEGKAINYEYNFNRLEFITYPNFTENNVTYVYGDPGAPNNGANRIISITDESGTETRHYGKLGEITRIVKNIASDTKGNSKNSEEEYQLDFEYDTWNRIRSVVYPDGTLNANGEVVTYAYDSGGLLLSIAGIKDGVPYPYLNNMEYDKFEDRVLTEFGNGVQTTVTYHPQHRRLMTMTTQGPNQLFQQLSYTYDHVGNMLSQANGAAVTSASQKGGATNFQYQYDDLYRLVGSDGQFAQVNKVHSYQLDMQYNTIHNIVSKNQTHYIGEPSGQQVRQHKTSYDWSYSYTGPQPHAPTQIGNRNFQYDANGNQLGWTHGQNATLRGIVWDEENRIQGMQNSGQGLTYKYNHEGKRVIKSGPQGETVYVSPYYTIRNGSTGTKHIYANKTRIVTQLAKQETQKNAKNNTTEERERYFYHRDHLGSGAYITDADGEIYQHLEYFSFGEVFVEEVSNIQNTPYWFTAKELDEETGLYYVEARYFDPRASIWLSVDPIMDSYLDGYPNKGVFEPTNLGVYTYVWNNPIKFVDPTGLLPRISSRS